MAKAEQGRWITIGGKPSEDGKRQHVGGSPVYVENGRITKGAPGLTGRVLANLKAEPELDSHSQQMHRERQYQLAQWHKRAREAGINPSDLDTLAHEMMAHDKMHVEDRKQMLVDARKKFRFFGYNPEAITTNLRRKGEFELPHLDQVAEELRGEHPEQFLGHDLDLYDRLVDLLTEGTPSPMSTDEAYQQAFDFLQEHGIGGSELSGEPLDLDDGPDIGDWSGGPVQAPQPTSQHPPQTIRKAWERFLTASEHAKPGGLFQGDMQARAGFAKLPQGAPVLFVEGQYRGQTGKIVRDEQHGNRVVAELDNHPEWGLVPVSPEAVEPLQSHLSWRTEYASAPSEQGGLFTASQFLPPRRDTGEEEIPFSKDARQNMTTSARRLTPAMQFTRQGEVVRQFAKQMGFTGGPSDVFAGPGHETPGDLAEALSYADPAAVDNAISQAKGEIKGGKLSPRLAVENLMRTYGQRADGAAARRLARAFEKAIAGNRSLAEEFQELADEEPTVPDTRQPEPIAASRDTSLSPAERERMARDSAAIRFARAHRQPMPEQFRDLPSEIKAVQRMADRLRAGNDFASAAAAYDEALRRYRAGS